jgi:hypothetical protein
MKIKTILHTPLNDDDDKLWRHKIPNMAEELAFVALDSA